MPVIPKGFYATYRFTVTVGMYELAKSLRPKHPAYMLKSPLVNSVKVLIGHNISKTASQHRRKAVQN